MIEIQCPPGKYVIEYIREETEYYAKYDNAIKRATSPYPIITRAMFAHRFDADFIQVPDELLHTVKFSESLAETSDPFYAPRKYTFICEDFIND